MRWRTFGGMPLVDSQLFWRFEALCWYPQRILLLGPEHGGWLRPDSIFFRGQKPSLSMTVWSVIKMESPRQKFNDSHFGGGCSWSEEAGLQNIILKSTNCMKRDDPDTYLNTHGLEIRLHGKVAGRHYTFWKYNEGFEIVYIRGPLFYRPVLQYIK